MNGEAQLYLDLPYSFGSFEIFKPADPQTGAEGPSVGNTELRKQLITYTVRFRFKTCQQKAHPSHYHLLSLSTATLIFGSQTTVLRSKFMVRRQVAPGFPSLHSTCTMPFVALVRILCGGLPPHCKTRSSLAISGVLSWVRQALLLSLSWAEHVPQGTQH